MHEANQATYQRILDRLELLEAVDAIRVGIEAAQEGRVWPARPALEALRAKLGITVDITGPALDDAKA